MPINDVLEDKLLESTQDSKQGILRAMRPTVCIVQLGPWSKNTPASSTRLNAVNELPREKYDCVVGALRKGGFDIGLCGSLSELRLRIEQGNLQTDSRVPPFICVPFCYELLDNLPNLKEFLHDHPRLPVVVLGVDVADELASVALLEAGCAALLHSPLHVIKVQAYFKNVRNQYEQWLLAFQNGSEISFDASKNASIEASGDSRLYFGVYELDTVFNKLKRSTEEIEVFELSRSETLTLACLIKAGHKGCSREYVIEQVFNREWMPFDRTLDNIVVKLRRILRRYPQTGGAVLHTIRSHGYALQIISSGDDLI